MKRVTQFIDMNQPTKVVLPKLEPRLDQLKKTISEAQISDLPKHIDDRFSGGLVNYLLSQCEYIKRMDTYDRVGDVYAAITCLENLCYVIGIRNVSLAPDIFHVIVEVPSTE